MTIYNITKGHDMPKIEYNINLLEMIKKRKTTQAEIAGNLRGLGLPGHKIYASTLSGIVNGTINASPERQEMIATALRCEVSEIF